jgi:hypothetical protein
LNIFRFLSSAENILNKFDTSDGLVYSQRFYNLNLKITYLNESSENLYDFGISSNLNLSFSLSENGFNQNYFQSILNNTNITYAGFYNPNVINQLIQNGNFRSSIIILTFFFITLLRFVNKIELDCLYEFKIFYK